MNRITLSEQVRTQTAEIARLTQELNTVTLEAKQYASDITRYRGMETKLADALAEVEKLKKELETSKNSERYQREANSKSENELEQAHAVLDSVAGAPAREYDGEYGKRHRNVVTRLAGAFLAIAQSNGAVAK